MYRWHFFVISNIILVHLFNPVDSACVQTINEIKSFRTTKHLGMLNHHSLTSDQV